MKRPFFVVLMFLVGCVTVQGYKDSLQTWMGHNDSELIQAWGQPSNSYTSPDGKTILDYHRERSVVIPGYTYNQAVTSTQNGTYTGDVNGTYNGNSTTYVPHTTPAQVVNKYCDTRFTVSNHSLVSYSFNGNDCVGVSPNNIAKQNNANNKNNESQELFKNWKARYDAFCSNPEYKIITDRSPCDLTNVSLELLADKTKITPEQKPVFVKFRTGSGDLAKEFRTNQRQFGGVNGGKLADLAESMQPEYDKNALALYEEKISWGEYVQRRRDFINKFNIEGKRISQP